MPNRTPVTTFRQIVSPVTPEEFFDGIWEQRAAHIPATGTEFEHEFSWAEFNRLLNMSKLWSDRCMKIVLDGQNLDLAEHGRVNQTRDWQRERALSERYGHFDLPSREHATHYRVRSLGTVVDPGDGAPVLRLPGGELSLKQEEEGAVLWILGRDYVDATELEERFGALGPDGLRTLLERLEASSVLDEI